MDIIIKNYVEKMSLIRRERQRLTDYTKNLIIHSCNTQKKALQYHNQKKMNINRS